MILNFDQYAQQEDAEMKKKKTEKKQRNNKTSKSEKVVPLFDNRAAEETLAEISKLIGEREFASEDELRAFLQEMLDTDESPETSPGTPLEQAQDLIYEAWESSSRSRRTELAAKALAISGDCADAYAILAQETANSLEEAKNLYELGVKAGDRALGPEVFEEDAGHFWGILTTRPYMRARAGLAECLWQLGEYDKAIEHYFEMLRLNPGDNQGIRYELMNCLLDGGFDEAAGKLLKQHKDDGAATCLYSRALWMFRREGATEKAKACLREALKRNPFVPPYLLGKKKLPRYLPEYYSWGDENEAIGYAVEAIRAWKKTKGALEWLATHLASYHKE